MHVTTAMITAARRAEYDYYQKGRVLGADRFIPTPDPVIRAMLGATLKRSSRPLNPSPEAKADASAARLTQRRIVTAVKLRRSR